MMEDSNKLWEIATKSSKYNSSGKCIISEQDEDFTHDEWDELYPKKREIEMIKTHEISINEISTKLVARVNSKTKSERLQIEINDFLSNNNIGEESIINISWISPSTATLFYREV